MVGAAKVRSPRILARWALAALALAGSRCLPAADAASEPLKVIERRTADGVEVRAHNTDPDAVRWVWVELVGPQNIVADAPLPAGFVLDPGEERRLFTLRPQEGDRGYAYALRTRGGEGDPNREPDPKAVYLLPWEHGVKHLVTQGYFGRVTHQGLYALDFDLAEGSAVCAARDGVVIGVKEDSNEGGTDARFADDGNYVKILHGDDTWAIYAHLQWHGAAVQPGQRVLAGQRIGVSGHTGLASGPHLHFAVYRAGFEKPISIPTVFLVGLSATAGLEEGQAYYAWHPGGAPFKTQFASDFREADLRGLTRTARGDKVTVRQERVDRRDLVWAENPTDHAIRLSVDVAEAQGVRASVIPPWRGDVPAHTEAYCFYVDFVGEGPSAYRLALRWRDLP